MKRFSFFLLALAACGGSSSSSSDDQHGGSGPAATSTSGTQPSGDPTTLTCIATTKSLCDHAAACGSDTKVSITYGVASETHDSKDKCETFYQFYVCAQAEYAKEYGDACGKAIETAACSNGALVFPSACGKK